MQGQPGDQGALNLCDALVDHWMLSYPYEPKGTTHHNQGPDRADGRNLWAFTQLYLTTGRADLAVHAKKVYDIIESRPDITMRRPDPRRGDFNWWPAWEVATKAWGMRSAEDVLGLGHDRSSAVAEVFYEEGTKVIDGVRRVGYTVSEDGSFFAPAGYGIQTWTLPAIQIASPAWADEMISADPEGIRDWVSPALGN